jgi:hypothetical protein
VSRLVVVVALAASALGGCTSVKVVQRDGCWVRQTKKIFSATEELGPCGRPEPKWSDDRLTRVTQECVAQADYRWQSRASEAWSRGLPLPDRPSDDTVLKDCMDQVSRSQLAENERLQQRLAELKDDKAALGDRADQDRTHLLAGYEKMAADLGLAARRPSPPAIATATAKSEGRTTSEGRSGSGWETAGEPRVVSTEPIKAAPVPAHPPVAKKASSPPSSCPPTSGAGDSASNKITKTSAEPAPAARH